MPVRQAGRPCIEVLSDLAISPSYTTAIGLVTYAAKSMQVDRKHERTPAPVKRTNFSTRLLIKRARKQRDASKILRPETF